MEDELNALAARERFWERDYESLSRPLQIVRSIWEMDAEVRNGGFYQYFWNSGGDLVPHILPALAAIEASEIAEIVARALDAAGPLPWSDLEARRAIMDDREDEIYEATDQLEDAFYARAADLTRRLHGYAVTHATELNFPVR